TLSGMPRGAAPRARGLMTVLSARTTRLAQPSGQTSLAAPGPRTSAAGRSRLFPPGSLGLLEAPDRDQWQKPDLIMDALKIAEGDVVAELGVAGGWFTARLARRVGPNGLVYAEDLQSIMLGATR